MTNVSDRIESTKNKITEPLPTPPNTPTSQKVRPEELLKRLKWGEPALTIVDIRDRASFNGERITGAVPMPMDQLPDGAESLLEYKRDIYVYGDSDETVTEAAQQLRQTGFQNVAELQGGLAAWKVADGPTEGVYAFPSPAEPPQPSAEPDESAQSSAQQPESSEESEGSQESQEVSAETSNDSSDQPQS